jgi:hypothetical protein
MQELIVETLTKKRFSDFMSLSNFRLQIEILRVRWAQRRMQKSKATEATENKD